MNQEESVFRSNENEETTVSLRELVEKYMVHWRWLLLSIVLCLVIGWLYARYSKLKYESSISVLIEKQNNNFASNEADMLKDLGLANGGSELEDEIELFKSRSLMEHVVRDLHLNWKYENLGTKTGFVRSELYKTCPVQIRAVSPDSTFFDKKFEFNIELTSSHEYNLVSGLV